MSLDLVVGRGRAATTVKPARASLIGGGQPRRVMVHPSTGPRIAHHPPTLLDHRHHELSLRHALGLGVQLLTSLLRRRLIDIRAGPAHTEDLPLAETPAPPHPLLTDQALAAQAVRRTLERPLDRPLVDVVPGVSGDLHQRHQLSADTREDQTLDAAMSSAH